MQQHSVLSFLFSSPHIAFSWLSSFSLNGSLLVAFSSFSFLCSFLFLCPCTYSRCVFSKAVVSYSLIPLAFLPSNFSLSLSLSLGFMLYLPSPHRKNPWAKALKFFVSLSIYKTLFLFPLELGIHYFFNKKSIHS